jgi:uncharacterized membrane protein YeaQ/YmgE (transglycosylase-associated protein family)
MTIEQIVIWIIVGGIAGILASALIRGIRLDLIGAIIVGILGAIIGGWLFGLLGITIGAGIISDIVTALVGSVLLLLLLRSLRRL